MSTETIPQMFFAQAERYASRALLWAKREGRYRPMTWAQVAEAVRALGTVFLKLQVNPGDRVLILSENRAEWGIADLAIQSVGALTVPIYASLMEGDIAQIAGDCEPVVCVTSNAEQAAKLRRVRERVPSIRHVIVMEAVPGPGEQSWKDAMAEGKESAARLKDLLERRLEGRKAEDTATLIYTSGTTGVPKGVMLSHHNFLSNAAACHQVLPIGPEDVHLSFLPLCHVFERMAGWYLMLLAGASVAYAETMDTVPQNMLEVRPTIMLGVPRFFEKLYDRVQEAVRHSPPLKRGLAEWAFGIGGRMSRCRVARQAPSRGLWLQFQIAKALVLRKLRARMGGRLRFFVSGGAPLAKAIAEFFHSADITILEGYGLTETSPVIAVNRPDALRFGTVGPLVSGVEVRFAEDGEIQTKGPHVMQGYYRREEDTREVYRDGWLSTGDIGCLDDDGFLTITDRKKDLIKTAGGKYIAPQKLENRFVMDPYITQAFVYGDRERCCVALIVPDLQRVCEYATKAGHATASGKDVLRVPAIHDWLWGRVQALQQDLPSFEQVKAIALLDEEFSQAGGELTPTMKAKRAIIAARYADRLKELYQ